MNFNECFEAACRAFGHQEVERYKHDDNGIHVFTFVETTGGQGHSHPRSRSFYMIDPSSGRGVMSSDVFDMQTEYSEALMSFDAGFRSQKYCLRLFDITDWDKTVRLLFVLDVQSENIRTAPRKDSSMEHWAAYEISCLEEIEAIKTSFAFFDVDLNAKIRILYAANFFGYFSYSIYEYEENIVKGIVKISDDVAQYLQGEFEGYSSEEEFWDIDYAE